MYTNFKYGKDRFVPFAAPFLLGAALDVYFVGAGCLVA